MSFSFSRLGSRDELLAKVRNELDEVVKAYPCHAADVPVIDSAAASMIHLLTMKENEIAQASISGSMWTDEGIVRQANFSVTVSAFVPTGHETEFGTAYQKGLSIASGEDRRPDAV